MFNLLNLLEMKRILLSPVLLVVAGIFVFSQQPEVSFRDSMWSYNMSSSGDSSLAYRYYYDRDSAEQVVKLSGDWLDANNKVWHHGYIMNKAYDDYGNTTLYETYVWDEASASWKGSGEKLEYLFDADGHKLMEAVYSWDTTDNVWFGEHKYEYIVAPNHEDVLIQNSYKWNPKNETWGDYIKWTYDYTADGNVEAVVKKEWDNGNDKWVDVKQEKRSYDSQGRLVSTLSLVWDADNSDWVNFHKNEYTYDQDGTQHYILYYWDDHDNSWQNYLKGEKRWDKQGHLIYFDEYQWNKFQDKWEGFEKEEKKYDENGNLTLWLFYAWDQVQEIWVNASKSVYKLDDNGRMVLKDYMTWDTDNDVWVNSKRDEFAWSPEGWLLMHASSTWDDHTNDWRCTFRIETTYDPCGKKLWVRKYRWSNDAGALLFTNSEHYFYQGYLFEETASVCPGDSVLWRGVYLKDEGVHTQSYSSVTCRDSSYRMTLSFYDKPADFDITGSDTVDANELTVYSVPENGQVTYTWSLEGGNVISHPSDNSLQVQWGDPGEGMLYAVASNQYGCHSDTATLKVVIGVTGVEETAPDEVVLYPNPVRDHIQIQSPGRVVRVEMYDLSGKALLTTDQKNIDLSGMDPGVYVVKIRNRDGKLLKTVRVVKR